VGRLTQSNGTAPAVLEQRAPTWSAVPNFQAQSRAHETDKCRLRPADLSSRSGTCVSAASGVLLNWPHCG
jgi:hypothetical protein